MAVEVERITIFGGGGFIGSHVADAFAKAGYDVLVADKNLTSLMEYETQFKRVDILDFGQVDEAVSGSKFVFNFAARADMDNAESEPLDFAKVNILGNLNLIKACEIHGVRRYFLASSYHVSNSQGGFYSCTKRAAEDFVKNSNLRYTILRIGSAYGARSTPDNQVHKIVEGLLNKDQSIQVADLNAIRELIHVKDIANACVRCLTDEFEFKTLLLTGMQKTSIKELIRIVSEILGVEMPNIFEKKRGAAYHYIYTPYRHNYQLAEKYIPATFIDLGQGLEELAIHLDSQRSDLEASKHSGT